MYFNNNEFTLLSYEQIFGNKKIDVIDKMGLSCEISDFALLLGALPCYVPQIGSDKNITNTFCLSSAGSDGGVYCARTNGCGIVDESFSGHGIRPVLPYSNVDSISFNGVIGKEGFLEVEYGEYPQYAVEASVASSLESYFLTGKANKTGKTYTTDSIREKGDNETPFCEQQHEEYEFDGKRYIRIKSPNELNFKLSNGENNFENKVVWLEVSPIKWIVDSESKLLVSKTSIASGIRFCNSGQYKGDFKNTEMYQYLNNYFSKDMLPSTIKRYELEDYKQYISQLKSFENKIDFYGLNEDDFSLDNLDKGRVR